LFRIDVQAALHRRAVGEHRHVGPRAVHVGEGGFIGLLRPELYERMLAAIPEGVIRFNQQVDRIEQDERAVEQIIEVAAKVVDQRGPY
jgi:hypothetical protein